MKHTIRCEALPFEDRGSARYDKAAGGSRQLLLALVMAAVVLLSPGRAHAGTPTVDANANGNVALNGQLKVDLEGLDGVVATLDRDLARLLKTTQTQARDDIANVLRETKVAISDQLAQVRSASVAGINLVATRLDAQLRTLLTQAQALANQTAQVIAQAENALNKDLQGIEQAVFLQIQAVHSDLLETLKVIQSDIDRQLDRAYVRAQDAATALAFQSRGFVDNAVLVAVRGVLSALFLILLMRVTRQATEAIRKRDRVPAEPIVGAALLCGVVVLLVSKPLLAGALGIPTTSIPPDPCASAVSDYQKFVSDKDLALPAVTVRFEGITVQEELQRCAYLSVSTDRAEGAAQLMSGVRTTLAQLPDSVAAVVAKQ